jgi:hypothetical protein
MSRPPKPYTTQIRPSVNTDTITVLEAIAKGKPLGVTLEQLLNESPAFVSKRRELASCGKLKCKKTMSKSIGDKLRARISSIIKAKSKDVKVSKGGSAVKDLGCSLEELMSHLESKFTKGMNWDNYGEWHIDHIMPLSIYDLTNELEFKKAVHYSNLQPLWAIDNLRKSNKIPKGRIK